MNKQSAGGKARAAAMTPQERSESARKAVRARWGMYRAEPEVRWTVVTGAAQWLSDSRGLPEKNTWSV